MDEALNTIRQLAATVSDYERHHVMRALHDLAYSMETPDDTLHRYGSMNLQTAAVKIGLDLGLFKLLAEDGRSVSVERISEQTGADGLLLSRIMKYLAAIGAVGEVSGNEFTANHLTKNLTEKVTQAGVNHYFATVAPQYQALPAFLERTAYKNPDDEMHTVFQDAWKTSLHGFAWFADHPENLRYFNDFMAFRREPHLSWLTVYPVADDVKQQNLDANTPLYVNIGGGVGHQCAQFKEKYPNLPGRVILQDLPHSIENALQTPGVENMAHDFFQPQPIKGAKFYFMRGVFHNHPPHKVLQLLQNTKEAMKPESVLLIDEMVLPDTKAHIDAVSMDITMLAAFAGMERSEAQWRAVINEAGLIFVDQYIYNPLSHESVIKVRLPQ